MALPEIVWLRIFIVMLALVSVWAWWTWRDWRHTDPATRDEPVALLGLIVSAGMVTDLALWIAVGNVVFCAVLVARSAVLVFG